MRPLLAALAAALPFAVLVGCHSSTHPPAEVGHLLVGPAGDEERRGIELAMEEIDADPNRRPAGMALVVRHASGGQRPEELVGQAARLLSLNRVHGLIGPISPDAIDRMAALTQGENGIVLSTRSGPATNGRSAPPSLYFVGPSIRDRTRALAVHARAALLQLGESDRVIWVVRPAKSTGPSEAIELFCRESQMMARARTVESLPAGAAGLVVCDDRPEAMIDVRRATSLPIYYLGEGPEVDEARRATEMGGDVWVASAYDLAQPTERLASFADRYRSRHGQPVTEASLLAHDALTMLVEAARRAEGLDAAKLRQQFQSTDHQFELITGPTRFTAEHHLQRPVVVRRLVNPGK